MLAVLLSLAVLGSALAGPWVVSLEPRSITQLPEASAPAPPPPAPTTQEPAPSDVSGASTADLSPLIWVAVAAALALTAWFARWLRGRLSSVEPVAAEPLPDLAEPGPHLPTIEAGVAEAETWLRREGEPADAVVAAWVALETAARRSGVPRDPAATPTEFVLQVLDRTAADGRATRSLLEAYERARFSRIPVSAQDVDRAAEDLRTIALTLREGGRTR